MEWIPHDGHVSGLPDWASEGRGVVLGSEGLAFRGKGTGLWVRWPQILGVVQIGAVGFILVPRQPPNPPWIEVKPKDLPTEAATLPALIALINARKVSGGYRATTERRVPLGLAELERRVLAREGVPGAVEIPPRVLLDSQNKLPYWAKIMPGFGGLVGGAVVGIGALALGMAAHLPDLAAVLFYGGGLGGGITGVTVGKKLQHNQLARPENIPRILVMAPDGCVIGFETGRRALAWSDIDRFVVEQFGDHSYLSVYDHEQNLGRIQEGWFGKPLQLIVGVANAYRKSVQ